MELRCKDPRRRVYVEVDYYSSELNGVICLESVVYDDGTDVPEDLWDWLVEHNYAQLNQAVLEHLQDRADSYADAARDRDMGV